MKVRAIRVGYFDNSRRKIGEVFNWSDDVPLGSWVVDAAAPVEDEQAEPQEDPKPKGRRNTSVI